MEQIPVVYAYPCRWDMTPARQRYLMEALSKHVPVYFLNFPNLRGSYTETFRPRAERISDQLTVIHDAFGARFSRGFKRLGPVAAAVDARWLHDVLRASGVHEYVYWLSGATRRWTWSMRTDRLIYDCIDPCFNSNDRAAVDREELALGRMAKAVFCTAESLLERLQKVNEHSYLLPNACSPQEYDPRSLQARLRPAALAGRSGPVVGYMGTFDVRVDVETILHAARKLPNVTFALPGRVNEDQVDRVAPLRALSNVVMPGSVSVEEGRAYVAAFDVGLVPFVAGEIGDGVNPVKMYMYLMAGKPVVSTWIRECRRSAPFVTAAQTPDEFTAAIVAALTADPAAAAQRTDFALRNTWAVRAAEAFRILSDRGLLEPARSTLVAS